MVTSKNLAGLKPEVVIFDLDGTMLNSQPLINDCLRMMVRDMFGPERAAQLTDASMQKYLGPPLMFSMQDINPQGTEADWDAMIAWFRGYFLPRANESDLFAGIPQTLETLRKRGYRLAVGTSKMETAAIDVLTHHGVADFFETIGGAASDLGRTTKAEVLHEVLRRVGLSEHPERALMIGDRFYDAEGAAKWGIPCILATWNKPLDPGEDEKAVGVVGSTDELLALLPGRNQD